jgi:hypothetical protein
MDMDDYEAREFSERCKSEVGINYKNEWVEILVLVNGNQRRLMGHHVTIVEGRDHGKK